MSGDGITAKVIGLEAANQRLLYVLGDQGKKAVQRANEANAEDFYNMIRRIVPQDEQNVHGEKLVDTVTKRTGVGQTGASAVSIGSETVRYPLHLETGHRMPDGSHTPGKPYWFPAIRLMKKKFRDRLIRAYRTSLKAGFAAGRTGGG